MKTYKVTKETPAEETPIIEPKEETIPPEPVATAEPPAEKKEPLRIDYSSRRAVYNAIAAGKLDKGIFRSRFGEDFDTASVS